MPPNDLLTVCVLRTQNLVTHPELVCMMSDLPVLFRGRGFEALYLRRATLRPMGVATHFA